MFALHFREQIASLGQFLLNELDQIVSAAQAKWFAQHDDTGGHTAVTAESVAATVLDGRQVVVGEGKHTAAPTTGPFLDEEIVVVEPDRPGFIVTIRPVDNTSVYLLSMSTVGRSIGELVLLRHEYEFGLTAGTFQITSFTTRSIPATAAPFFTPGDGGGTNYTAIQFGAGQAVLCRLERAAPVKDRSAQTYWRTLGVLGAT